MPPGLTLRRILAPVVAVTLYHLILLVAYVHFSGGDIAVLICPGTNDDAHYHAGRYPFELVSASYDGIGHDGQFYYALARNPFGYHRVGLDRAPVRQVRLLYPLLCWLLTGGEPHLLFWALPFVNLLAIAGLTAFGAALALEQKLSPWWGALLPMAVNVGLPALHSLTDIVSTLTVGGLLCGWLWRWPAWSLALWATAALFCRLENFAVVIVLLGLAGWRRRTDVVVAHLPGLLLWFAWVVWVRYLYGVWPIQPRQLEDEGYPPGFGNFSPPLWPGSPLPTPFWGLVWGWVHLDRNGPGPVAMNGICMGILTWQLLLIGALLWWRSDAAIVLTALAGAALVAVSGQAVYGHPWDYPRVFTWLPLAVWIGAVRAKQRWVLVSLSLPTILALNELLRLVRTLA